MSDKNGRNRNVGFRLVMLGEQGVGKSSISHRLVVDEFKNNNAPTIGAAYLNKTFKVDDIWAKLDLWDTAGQERFASLAPMYYRTAQAAIVTYDITKKTSFRRAMEWIKELHNQAPVNTVIMLCGNKVDIREHREVTTQAGQELASDKGLMFAEVSAKTGQGVKTMFYNLAETLVKSQGDKVDGSGRHDLSIDLRLNETTKNKCAC